MSLLTSQIYKIYRDKLINIKIILIFTIKIFQIHNYYNIITTIVNTLIQKLCCQ